VLPTRLNPSLSSQVCGQCHGVWEFYDQQGERLANSAGLPYKPGDQLTSTRFMAQPTRNIEADGRVHDLKFTVPVTGSSWIAARVIPAAHTNPIFAVVGGKPIRASRRSAEWCLNAVNQCWTQKAPRISPRELGEAKTAYDHARDVYRRLIQESPGN